jgi:hypothetical protein
VLLLTDARDTLPLVGVNVGELTFNCSPQLVDRIRDALQV